MQCTPQNPSACDGTTPVCDDAQSACVGCSFHEQCPDSACRIATGGCFDSAEVYTVGNGGDFDTLADALAAHGGGGEVVLRLLSASDFNETATVSGAGTAVALLDDAPDDDVLPQWINSMDAAATLSLLAGAELYAQGIRFSGNLQAAHPGIDVDDASLWLDRCAVVQNAGGGITLAGGAYASVRNCFVGGNGNQFQAHHGVSATDSTLDIVYTSIVANDGNGADSLACTGSGGTVRNSILLGSDTDSVDCPGVSLSENALDVRRRHQRRPPRHEHQLVRWLRHRELLLNTANAPASILTPRSGNPGPTRRHRRRRIVWDAEGRRRGRRWRRHRTLSPTDHARALHHPALPRVHPHRLRRGRVARRGLHFARRHLDRERLRDHDRGHHPHLGPSSSPPPPPPPTR
ncbi:MAG: hypothetical protein U0168_29110 [Nannocystaceae bacterium]